MSNPVIGADIIGGGRIFGRKVSGSPSEEGMVGTLNSHPVSPNRIKAAAKLYPDLSGLVHVTDDGQIADNDGRRYVTVGYDPLTRSTAYENIAGYIANDTGLYFLEETTSAAAAEAAQTAVEETKRHLANEHQKFLSAQKQVPVLANPGSPELRESVELVLAHGGRIELGEHGEVSITLPERLLESTSVLDGLAEVELRKWVDHNIANIVAGQKVVAAALASNSKKTTLAERIGPGWVTAGGGLTT